MSGLDNENVEERLSLVMERIREIPKEAPDRIGRQAFERYFSFMARFLIRMDTLYWDFLAEKWSRASLEELQAENNTLYEDILPQNYGNSYANPAFAVNELGEEFGRLLSFLYCELRSMIPFACEGRLEELVIRMELFVEVYGAFVCEQQENGGLPSYDSIHDIVYWFVCDYADISAERRVRERVCPENNLAVRILKEADFADARYLYRYGEYVGGNQLETARFLAALPEETIRRMADTYTEGYRIGFEVCNKDLSRKKTVDIRYTLGFERMIAKAVENFAAMGLQPVIWRSPSSMLYDPLFSRDGFVGGIPNRQYDFDHKDDKGLFLDKNYVNRKLEVLRTAFAGYKEEARGYAGPAVVETFGEALFEPVNKPERVRLTKAQEELLVEYRSESGRIQREYILEEERSFTIIAFPVPEIGDRFPEIFDETIRINTLDYQRYRSIQQIMIDALDRGDYCEIKGRGRNRTDLKVNLYKRGDPERETIFENCVADVNIPVGEVFTSPVLKGTNGVLHVGRVFLNGLEYRDLEITFEDGMTAGYTCGNFPTEEENKAFIRENILFHHKSLPLGEFAIGTNTAAYVMARKYGIEALMPILIAEKTGPHFAVGDTCYSHAEDVRVFNPDGKEIAARDNEVSMLRKTRPEKAYFNCHTDITIPYDELGELTAVTARGERIPILADGRFVLPGCEELNGPLDGSECENL